MTASDFSIWFWLALSFLLVGLWLWTLLLRAAPAAQASTPELMHQAEVKSCREDKI
jgi:hypothetical protein